MNFQAKQLVVMVISLFFLGSLITVGYIESERLLPEKKAKAVVTKKNLGCVNCHTEKSPGVVTQWRESRHASLGVGCLDCHQAKEGEPDAWDHEGSLTAIIPTPKDCARCHEPEAKQFAASAHARAAESIGRLDNFRGVVSQGSPASMGGCQKCHGSTVKVVGEGRIDPATWLNSGAGRINPDGSKGSCAACHARHQFSPAQARQPESCGRCHLGSEHSQIEAYDESKHGKLYRARIDEMNLKSTDWIAGEHYAIAPTCATCHMSATKHLPVTHNVDKRIGRAPQPIVSKKREGLKKKRKDMQSVCTACHGPDYTKAFYAQYDGIMDRYNEKFAGPAERMMNALGKEGKITSRPFDDKIEWSFFDLWHNEGRRAREFARRFSFDFLPEAEKLSPGISGRAASGR